jgi:hypothetical protein
LHYPQLVSEKEWQTVVERMCRSPFSFGPGFVDDPQYYESTIPREGTERRLDTFEGAVAVLQSCLVEGEAQIWESWECIKDLLVSDLHPYPEIFSQKTSQPQAALAAWHLLSSTMKSSEPHGLPWWIQQALANNSWYVGLTPPRVLLDLVPSLHATGALAAVREHTKGAYDKDLTQLMVFKKRGEECKLNESFA